MIVIIAITILIIGIISVLTLHNRTISNPSLLYIISIFSFCFSLYFSTFTVDYHSSETDVWLALVRTFNLRYPRSYYKYYLFTITTINIANIIILIITAIIG